jgi:hypothetical protein
VGLRKKIKKKKSPHAGQPPLYFSNLRFVVGLRKKIKKKNPRTPASRRSSLATPRSVPAPPGVATTRRRGPVRCGPARPVVATSPPLVFFFFYFNFYDKTKEMLRRIIKACNLRVLRRVICRLTRPTRILLLNKNIKKKIDAQIESKSYIIN